MSRRKASPKPPDGWDRYFARMAAAERCPIAGPCPDCKDEGPHACAIGEREKAGASPRAAVMDELIARVWEGGRSGEPRDPSEAGSALLPQLCQHHRRLVERLLAKDLRSILEDSPSPD